MAFAKKLPNNAKQVSQVARGSRRNIGPYADKVARIISVAKDAPQWTWPQSALKSPPEAEANERAAALIDLVERRSTSRSIDQALVASRSELRRLARYPAHKRRIAKEGVLSGWRRELLGWEFERLLYS